VITASVGVTPPQESSISPGCCAARRWICARWVPFSGTLGAQIERACPRTPAYVSPMGGERRRFFSGGLLLEVRYGLFSSSSAAHPDQLFILI